MSKGVDIVLGTHMVGDATDNAIAFFDGPDVNKLLDAFAAHGHTIIDTASNYAKSEDRLAKAGAPSRFTIDTKVQSFDGPGFHQPARIRASLAKSLEDLRVDSVRTLYLHVPDRETPFEDTARTMHELVGEGKCLRWGISNHSAAEVRQFLEICEKEGFVKPAVYQGQYNAIVRSGEKELFPLLREHGMAFYAFSVGAGGLFADQRATSKRWTKDAHMTADLYLSFYMHEPILTQVELVRKLSKEAGINPHNAVMRWAVYHSVLDSMYGDAVIIGQSKLGQTEDTLKGIEEGPLPENVVAAINAVHALCEGKEQTYHL